MTTDTTDPEAVRLALADMAARANRYIDTLAPIAEEVLTHPEAELLGGVRSELATLARWAEWRRRGMVASAPEDEAVTAAARRVVGRGIEARRAADEREAVTR